MMLSEMFNFQNGGDLLGIPSHLHAKQPGNVMNWRGNGGIGYDWYNRQGGGATNSHLASLVVSKGSGSNNDHTAQDEDHDNMNNNGGNGNHQGRNNINADAAAMHLFLMNPEPDQPSAPMHMLLPGASAMQVASQLQHLHPGLSATFGSNPNNEIPEALQLQQLNWVDTGSTGRDKSRNWGISENQGLSLSLSSLQHLEAAMKNEETAAEGKGEELRVDGVVYYPPDQGHQGGLYSLSSAGVLGNSVVGLTGSGARTGMSGLQQVHLGSRSTTAVLPVHSAMILRNSKYLRAAQELLGEFCSVGRGQMKGWRLGKQDSAKWPSTDTSKDTNNPSSSHPPISSSDRFEQQRKKTKLLSMLDELDRRYHHYCEQMQQVMYSFDSVLGLGSALPYTSLAQKAMSRHFRCLRDAMVSQLRATSELLGEKDAGVIGGGGITKGETPRLRLLEQSLRQQRAAFHGMLVDQADQAWRPQRGLPERSVNILRAWLFEHFLHPYPSDADKHLLARQTGLSRNQVSNWFINARVRLWKPMVEDMYQEEAKEEGSESTAAETSEGKRPEVNIAAEKPQTTNASAEKTASIHNHSNSAANAAVSNKTNSGKNDAGNFIIENDATPRQTQMAPLFGDSDSFDLISSRVLVDGHLPVGYGGNGLYHGRDLSHISLTLGLRHADGLPEQSQQQGRFNKHDERQLLRDFAG